MNVEIRINSEQLAALQQALQGPPRQLDRIRVSAANRVGAWVKTQSLRAITSEINIKRKDIDANRPDAHRYGGVALVRAGGSRPAAHVAITGRRIPLYRFGAVERWPSGVFYRIAKGGKRGQVKNAFVARMQSGHEGAFVRQGKARFPIAELHGPSLPHVTEKRAEYKAIIQGEAAERMAAEVQRLVDLAMSRRAGNA